MLGRRATGRIAPAVQRLLILCRLQALCPPLCLCKFVCAGNSAEFRLECLLLVAMLPEEANFVWLLRGSNRLPRLFPNAVGG